jgi:NSS family neurotransmitter:Na+ symporter
MFAMSLLVCYDKLGAHSSWLPFAPSSRSILDLYDFFAEGVFMPLGAILMCIIVGWKLGMPWMKDEITQSGNKFYMEGFFKICVKFITPVLMAFVLVSLVIGFFGI